MHNLAQIEFKEDVAIELDEIKRSALNPLEPSIYPFKTKPNQNSQFYEEKNPLTIHLIIARVGSEAGNFYNPTTLKFLRNAFHVAE